MFRALIFAVLAYIGLKLIHAPTTTAVVLALIPFVCLVIDVFAAQLATLATLVFVLGMVNLAGPNILGPERYKNIVGRFHDFADGMVSDVGRPAAPTQGSPAGAGAANADQK